MSKANSIHSQIPSIPKENNMGMDGMDEISMSNPSLSNHSRNDGNDWERLGMDASFKPRKGMFFHSFDAEGKVENQGYLLVLTAAGFGRAQLFEWLTPWPRPVSLRWTHQRTAWIC